MDYDKILATIAEDVKVIRQKLEAVPRPAEPGQTANMGGLYQFVRPAPMEPRYGQGIRMSAPDKPEALLRAVYGVRWNGDVVRTGVWEDEVWEEIEKLKVDPELQAKYNMLDPEFAGFALLTGLLDITKYDSFIGHLKREAMRGKTVQSFLDEQWAIMAGGARPSGDEP